MPASAAQISANRKNAALSTGPTTEAGKERSRGNGWKHGLTGEGIVVPDGELAAIEARFQSLREEFQPEGTASCLHLRRFASMSLRLESCEKVSIAVYAMRVRHAEEEFDDHRRTVVESLASRIESEPSTVVRRLQAMPEGVDWLIGQWDGLRVDLMNRERDVWTQNHSARAERLLGRLVDTVRQPRSFALREAMSGYFVNIDPSELAGLTASEKAQWGRKQLASLIDAEVERLKLVKAALDPSKIELDRRESVDRCLFGLQPEMDRVRKYESATERSMYRAFKEFQQAEAESRAIKAQLEAESTPGKLASSEPEDSNSTATDTHPTQPPPRTRPPSPPTPQATQITDKKGLDPAPITLGRDQNRRR